MIFWEIIRVALSALRANKLRSFLTMLGIVIGVGAVIAMVAISQGAQRQIQDRIAALGTTLLTVNPGQARGIGGIASEGGDRAQLDVEDSDILRDSARFILEVTPVKQRSLQIQWGSKNANINVVGTTSNYPVVQKRTMLAGRMFTDAEDAGIRRVAVLGPAVLEEFEIATPEVILGEFIRIRGIQFQVIGVMDTKAGAGGGNPDEFILIPFNTSRYRTHGGKSVNRIDVLAESEEMINDAMAEIQRLVRRQHKIRPGFADNFRISNQSDYLETARETQATFGFLLAGIAGVSLLVGGIGIMNIMLVSVTERTREIGVRKALGATKRNIKLQFLTEAIVLCVLGGMLGVAAGSGGAMALSNTMEFTYEVDMYAVAIAFLFSAGVGVLFGVWPAQRAAKLDPIQALRYE